MTLTSGSIVLAPRDSLAVVLAVTDYPAGLSASLYTLAGTSGHHTGVLSNTYTAGELHELDADALDLLALHLDWSAFQHVADEARRAGLYDAADTLAEIAGGRMSLARPVARTS